MAEPRLHVPHVGAAPAAGAMFETRYGSTLQTVVGSTHFALLAAVREFRAAPARTALGAVGCSHPLTRLFRLVTIMERTARQPWGAVAWDGREGPFAACIAEVGLVNTLADCQRRDLGAAASRLAFLLQPEGRAPALAAAEDAARAFAGAGVEITPLGA